MVAARTLGLRGLERFGVSLKKPEATRQNLSLRLSRFQTPGREDSGASAGRSPPPDQCKRFVRRCDKALQFLHGLNEIKLTTFSEVLNPPVKTTTTAH